MSLLQRPDSETSPDLAKRTPPGQYLTPQFPVLTYGQTPEVKPADWSLRIFGLVEEEITLDWDAFMELPQSTVVRDIHCVTRWSKLDTEWKGVLFRDLMKIVKPLPKATHVMQHCYGGYTTNLSLAEMMEEDVIIAHTFNGAPLEREHGGPMRVVVPKLYFWKSAKWVNGLQFMPADSPGFWERNGYHMHGDPWTEERYSGGW